MTGVDCNCALRLQVLFGDARENFLFDLRQAFSRRARNTQRVEMFPITVFRQIAFVQKHNFTAIVGAFLEMWRPWRVAIHDVETQVRGLERFFGARDSLALEFAGRRWRPAVSSKRIGTPRRLIISSMVSRVVPWV